MEQNVSKQVTTSQTAATLYFQRPALMASMRDGGEFDKKVSHDKAGLLSMANRGPGTDGSQFFLTFIPVPRLDGKHTIFGEVVEGRGTLKALERRGSKRGKPDKKLVIEKAAILVE